MIGDSHLLLIHSCRTACADSLRRLIQVGGAVEHHREVDVLSLVKIASGACGSQSPATRRRPEQDNPSDRWHAFEGGRHIRSRFAKRLVALQRVEVVIIDRGRRLSPSPITNFMTDRTYRRVDTRRLLCHSNAARNVALSGCRFM